MESEKDWAFWSSVSETSVRNKKRRIVYPENQMHAMECRVKHSEKMIKKVLKDKISRSAKGTYGILN